MAYVFAIFAWLAFVLLGVGLIVALEPVWNRDARAVAARGFVGCGPRALAQRRAAPRAPRRRAPARALAVSAAPGRVGAPLSAARSAARESPAR